MKPKSPERRNFLEPLAMYKEAKRLTIERRKGSTFEALAKTSGYGQSTIRVLIRWASSCKKQELKELVKLLRERNGTNPSYYLCCQLCLCRKKLDCSFKDLICRFQGKITAREVRKLELRESALVDTADRLDRISGAMKRLVDELKMAEKQSAELFRKVRNAEPPSRHNRALRRVRDHCKELSARLKKLEALSKR